MIEAVGDRVESFVQRGIGQQFPGGAFAPVQTRGQIPEVGRCTVERVGERLIRAERKAMPLAVISSRLTTLKTQQGPARLRSIRPKLFLQRCAKFREGMGNGLRQNEDQNHESDKKHSQ